MSDPSSFGPDFDEAERLYEESLSAANPDVEAMETAAATYRAVLARSPSAHPDRPFIAARLVTLLRRLFVASDDVRYIDEAIDTGRCVLDAATDPAVIYVPLAGALSVRFQLAGGLDDLDGSITLMRLAVAGPADVGRRAALLSNLALTLRTRFELTNDETALTEAVTHARAAISTDAATELTPNRSRIAQVTSSIVQLRYKLRGDMDDLLEARDLARHATALMPDGDYEQAGFLAHLASVEVDVYLRTSDATARTDALEHYDRALALLPRGDSAVRQVTLANQAALLETPTADDAVFLARLVPQLEANAAAARDTPRAGHAHTALAQAYLANHTITGDPVSLGNAVNAGRAAVRDAVNDEDRSISSTVLADALTRRWHRNRTEADIYEAIALLTAAVQGNPGVAPDTRAAAGRVLGTAHMTIGEHAAAHTALSQAVDLLPLVAWTGTDHTTREFRLVRFTDLGADAVAAALAADAPGQAVRTLESARAVLWNDLVSRRTSLDALAVAAPATAAELERVREGMAQLAAG
jgi:tetratricopeptide (TPR) repeat protein